MSETIKELRREIQRLQVALNDITSDEGIIYTRHRKRADIILQKINDLKGSIEYLEEVYNGQ